MNPSTRFSLAITCLLIDSSVNTTGYSGGVNTGFSLNLLKKVWSLNASFEERFSVVSWISESRRKVRVGSGVLFLL